MMRLAILVAGLASLGMSRPPSILYSNNVLTQPTGAAGNQTTYETSDLKNNGNPYWKETGQTCMREFPSGREVKDNIWVKRDQDLKQGGNKIVSSEIARMCGNPHAGGAGD